MEIKDYLKYYIGCECLIDNDQISIHHKGHLREITTNPGDQSCTCRLSGSEGYWGASFIKPILRRLSSMTEEEMKELDNTKAFHRATPVHQIGLRVWTAESFAWAINKGFWIFGNEAFETGLIIEKK